MSRTAKAPQTKKHAFVIKKARAVQDDQVALASVEPVADKGATGEDQTPTDNSLTSGGENRSGLRGDSDPSIRSRSPRTPSGGPPKKRVIRQPSYQLISETIIFVKRLLSPWRILL